MRLALVTKATVARRRLRTERGRSWFGNDAVLRDSFRLGYGHEVVQAAHLSRKRQTCNAAVVCEIGARPWPIRTGCKRIADHSYDAAATGGGLTCGPLPPVIGDPQWQ